MDLFYIIKTMVPLISIALMFGMGLALSLTDLNHIRKVPKKIIVGIISQLALLPSITFMVCIMFQLSPELSIGLMIIAACPGGPISNLTCHLVNANVALSVCLTSISTVFCIFTAPLVISFSVVYFLGSPYSAISITEMSITILLVTVVPVILGILIRIISPKLADKMTKPVKVLSLLFIFAMTAICIIQIQQAQGIEWPSLISASITVNATTIIVGALIALNAGLNLRDSATISFETGLQNFSLAIIIATTILAEPTYTVAIIIYGLVMLCGAMLCMSIFKRFQFKTPTNKDLALSTQG